MKHIMQIMNGEKVDLDGCYSTNRRMKLSDFVKNVKEKYLIR